MGHGITGEHGLVEKDLSRDEAHNYSMEVRPDPFESAKSHFFDTSSWGPFCDVTLTLKQIRQSDSGTWIKIDDYRCRQAFRHFMSLLNRAVYGAAFRRHGKRLHARNAGGASRKCVLYLPPLSRGKIHCSPKTRSSCLAALWLTPGPTVQPGSAV